MRFFEMGLVFAVVGFVVANAVLSLLTVLLWRAVRRSGLRASWLFIIRMIPALGSAALVVGVILPGYWFFEPRETAERAGPALAVFAVIATALLALGLRRVMTSWLETRRLERAWKGAGVRSTLPIPVPAYRVRSSLPLAALVGVFRPRLFISDRFLDVLLADERQAVLDHEAAHVAAFDNLKRTTIKLAPDWLFFSRAGREIEAAWALAAEEEADDRAAGPEGARSLDLAGALIKASRLAPVHFAPVSNFCEESTIVRRVARLLDDRPRGRGRPIPPGWRLALSLAVVTILGFSAGPGVRAAYTLSEAAVRLLHYGSW